MPSEIEGRVLSMVIYIKGIGDIAWLENGTWQKRTGEIYAADSDVAQAAWRIIHQAQASSDEVTLVQPYKPEDFAD